MWRSVYIYYMSLLVKIIEIGDFLLFKFYCFIIIVSILLIIVHYYMIRYIFLNIFIYSIS